MGARGGQRPPLAPTFLQKYEIPFYKYMKSNVMKAKVMKIVKNYEGVKIVIDK